MAISRPTERLGQRSDDSACAPVDSCATDICPVGDDGRLRRDASEQLWQAAPVSTRAILAYRSEPRRWKGVWNHWEGHPQYLGQELIDRVATFDGDVRRLVRQYIDHCPEGWSNFRQGERKEDPCGFLHGSIHEKGASVDDGMGLDTHYLYVFDLDDRSLSVFESDSVPVKPFGRVVFAASGVATPSQLPTVED